MTKRPLPLLLVLPCLLLPALAEAQAPAVVARPTLAWNARGEVRLPLGSGKELSFRALGRDGLILEAEPERIVVSGGERQGLESEESFQVVLVKTAGSWSVRHVTVAVSGLTYTARTGTVKIETYDPAARRLLGTVSFTASMGKKKITVTDARLDVQG